MLISKKAIKACEEVSAPIAINPYDAAIDHIMCAIKCLAEVASTDEKAKDNIVNLSVVLFDLK